MLQARRWGPEHVPAPTGGTIKTGGRGLLALNFVFLYQWQLDMPRGRHRANASGPYSIREQ